MKTLCAFAACVIVLACSQIFAGTEQTRTEATTEELNPQRFELAVESGFLFGAINPPADYDIGAEFIRSEEHTSELQSPCNLVCRLLLEKKKQRTRAAVAPRDTCRSEEHPLVDITCPKGSYSLPQSIGPVKSPSDSVRTTPYTGRIYPIY